MILSVENNLIQPTTLYSYLTNNISAGTTQIPVRNISGFSLNYAVQIGKTGEEQSEIRIIGAPSGTALPLQSGTLVYDHPLDTPIFQIHYNRIVFKRSITGTLGSAEPLSTVTITPDSLYTQYNDTSGAVTYAYKTQFYNSVSGDLSAESDWFIPSGPTFYSLQKLRKRIKDALYNSSYLADDTVIDDWINEWVEEMNNAAIKVNKGYAIGTASYTFGTAGYGTITESGFKKATKIEITNDGISWTPSTEIPMSEYSESSIFSSVYPRHSWEGDTRFRILPFGNIGTARFSFGQLHTQLVDDSDELPMPLRSYTTGCVEYGLFRAKGKDNKEDDPNYKRFLLKKNDFVSEMTPRDDTGPKMINIVEGLSGLNDDILLGTDFF